MGLVKISIALLLLLHLARDLSSFSVLADEIITSSSGRVLGRSSREPKYKVDFHSVDSPFYPEDGQESVMMSTKEGQNYMCFLPMVEETKSSKSVTSQNSSSIIIESERKIKLKSPDELMDALKERCFYRHEGWWTYEFCYQKHVKQLHLEDEKVVQEFVLGMFDPDMTAEFNENHSDVSTLKDPRAKDASQRYHAHQFTNGTACDLTNQPRETEVRFVCAEPSIVITSIKEISTCKYVVMVHCPLLCRHPLFQQERPTWHTIHCNEVAADIKEPSVDSSSTSAQIKLVPDDSGKYAT